MSLDRVISRSTTSMWNISRYARTYILYCTHCRDWPGIMMYVNRRIDKAFGESWRIARGSLTSGPRTARGLVVAVTWGSVKWFWIFLFKRREKDIFFLKISKTLTISNLYYSNIITIVVIFQIIIKNDQNQRFFFLNGRGGPRLDI